MDRSTFSFYRLLKTRECGNTRLWSGYSSEEEEEEEEDELAHLGEKLAKVHNFDNG